MAEVKWIKIVTDIFDDEKIKLIESLPDGDTVIVVWFKLLCLAGKQNNGGIFMINDRIPYTEDMLSTIFNRPISTIRLALETFESFGMIEIVDGIITIPSWDKHQSLDAYNKKLEQNRERQQRFRERKKLESNVTRNVTSRESNATEEEEEKEIEEDIELYPDNKNKNSGARVHLYGEYSNVRLTQEEYDKLAAEIPNVDKWIDKLSSYVKSSGKSYKSHYATIRNWYRREAEKNPSVKNPQTASYNIDEYELKNAQKKLVYEKRNNNERISEIKKRTDD